MSDDIYTEVTSVQYVHGDRVKVTKSSGIGDYEMDSDIIYFSADIFEALEKGFHANSDAKEVPFQYHSENGMSYSVFPCGRNEVKVVRNFDGYVAVKSKVDVEEHSQHPHSLAAKSYWEKYPTKKPWHDAKEGQVWEVSMPDGTSRFMLVCDTGYLVPEFRSLRSAATGIRDSLTTSVDSVYVINAELKVDVNE